MHDREFKPGHNHCTQPTGLENQQERIGCWTAKTEIGQTKLLSPFLSFWEENCARKSEYEFNFHA